MLVFQEKDTYVMKNYRPRILDKVLKFRLKCVGAVIIEGPKWCGKTTTGEQFSKSRVYFSDSDKKEQYLNLASLSPSTLLKGETPRLIDEWQLAPKLWDAIRFEVDHREEGLGQFILTGSAVPVKTNDIFHTGTGRFSRLLMRPMSLFESGDSNGEISLSSLFSENKRINGHSNLTIDRLAFLVCRGGWPITIDSETDVALEQAKIYVDAVINSDVNRLDGVLRNIDKIKKTMQSYARNQGTQASDSVIATDVINDGDLSITRETVGSYISALRKIFVIEDMPAWNPNLRSKTAIRTSNTRYFIDPSIAAASIGIGPNDLSNDLKTFGFIFETMCVRDLRVYADSLGGNVFHYRDKSGLECDAVIHLRNGLYGLIEIKLGGDESVEEAAKNLLRLKERIDTIKMKEPSFLMVLTGITEYAYQREDGVLVVPIGCLKD